MTPEALLEQLVGFPTVVGRSNAQLVDHVMEYLVSYGVKCAVVMGPEGDRFNLFATIGPGDRPGYILSGHLDVVPAREPEWLGDPFKLRRDKAKLIGRGACDMKGFVAAVLSAVPDLVKMDLDAPVHIALSYDEEAGCRGVPHLIRRLPGLCATPLGCIVGEPTNLVPVLRHKGKASIRLKGRGVSGHSSRPDQGRNAIHALVPALCAAVHAAEQAMQGPFDPNFEPSYSTVQIGTLEGGQALNIIPDHAEAQIEARAIMGVDPGALLDEVRAAVGADVEVEELAAYPALSLDEDAPLTKMMERLTGRLPLRAVSFGTEAGLFQAAGIPSVVCGPGDISRAHKPEEYILSEELRETRALVMALAGQLVAA